MLQRLREPLALVLLTLLPLHALLVTLGTKLIVGPGQAPLGTLAMWKEGLMGVILLIAIVEVISDQWSVVSRQRSVIRKIKIDVIDLLIIGLVVLAGIVQLAVRSPLSTALYGFRYDFVAPLAFLVLRRVPWSDVFRKRAVWIIIAVGALVALYGLVTLVLPDSFFRALGYSDLHSLYVPGGPIAAFQQLGGTAIHRVQSTMSGPNQLGLWLLLPWSLVLIRLFQGFHTAEEAASKKWKRLVILLVITLAILATFSRSSWISMVLSGSIILWQLSPQKIRVPLFSIAGSFAAILLLSVAVLYPEVIQRSVSNAGHIERPLEAMQRIVDQPLGHGLGTAGPASNRISDACVYLEEGADASWAVQHTDLCVFVGDAQVQPAGRACSCPFLPENWYLQIGIELGVIGMFAWVLMVILLLIKLRAASGERRETNGGLPMGVFVAFLGVSVAGLFLHSWEDAAVALSLWILAAAFARDRS